MPSVASADIRVGLGTSYTVILGALFAAPAAVALVVEPVLFVLADHYPRRWFVSGGLFAMALAAFAAAAAPSAPWLAAAVAVAWVGSGSGVALSQATLVDARPRERERVLARWTLLGEVGDLGAPLLLAMLGAVGLGWRSAYVVVGALALVLAVLLARRPFPPRRSPPDGGDEASGPLASIALALRNPALLLWLGASALCDLLDEVVVVLASLHMRDDLGVGPVERSFVLGAGVAGAIAGALLADRLLARVAPLRLLLASSVACATVYVGWLFAPGPWLGAVLFATVGATAAPMYPIAVAQAYAALPHRSGAVNAAGHLFTPFALALPWALGAVADAEGVRIALALLLAQPVLLAGIAAWAIIARRARAP